MRRMIVSAALACLCGLLMINVAEARGRGGRGCGGCGCCYSYGCGGGYCYGGYCGIGYHGVVHQGGKKQAMATVPDAATLVVSLPADAVLTIDGKPTTSTSAERVFQSPSLEKGRDFQYALEAKVVRDGQEKVITKLVTVRAGEQTNVTLTESAALAAE
jgi:uncharacterized protein (TIGR03000 family)